MPVKAHLNYSQSQQNINLSSQQQEVLRWTAAGKTTWETSIIMRCTEANVNYHLKQLFGKLQACNKVHAVSKAIQLGLIKSDK